MNRQSRFDAGYRKLGAGALGGPRGIVWGGMEGSRDHHSQSVALHELVVGPHREGNHEQAAKPCRVRAWWGWLAGGRWGSCEVTAQGRAVLPLDHWLFFP